MQRDRRTRHQSLSTRILRALQQHEFRLAYQGIHDIHSLELVAAEALLRWKKDATRQADIEELTEAAERGNEVFYLGQWVATTACQQVMKWPEGLRSHINLSARQFEQGDALAFMENVLRNVNVDPRRIALEITEKSFIHRPREVAPQIRRLQDLGFELWLDDFGTGHSSLEHLHALPVNGLKIAATYVRDLRDNTRSRAIVEAVLSLARSLNVVTIAEGVEDEWQRSFLTDAGCERIQGFLASRPLAESAFVARLRDETHQLHSSNSAINGQ